MKVTNHKSVLTAFLCSAILSATTLKAQEIVPPDAVQYSDSYTIESPLTTETPDAFRGLDVFVDKKLGNCVACHINFDVAGMQFLGEVGPNLDWLGDRMTPGEIRAILVDPKIARDPGTIMPAFYSSNEAFRTLEAFKGKTILTAIQVEDLVAYLSSLSQETGFDGVD